MSDQRHDPEPWSAPPPAQAGWGPYEESEGDGAPGGQTQFPPAAGQGDDGYAAPETQLGMALHEESAAAQQTAYLPPVTDAGPYGAAYGGAYGGGHGTGPYGDGHVAPYGGGQDSAGAGQPGGHGAAYGAGSLGGPGPGHGGGSPGGGGPGGRPAGQAAYPPQQAAGAAADETAYLPPAPDDGAARYGGTGAGGPSPHGGPGGGADVGQTAYLPPVTDHGPAAGDGAQWPGGWDRGGAGVAAPGPGHPGTAAHPGAAGGHPGTATGHPGATGSHPGAPVHPGTPAAHPAPRDPHPDVPPAGRAPALGVAAAGFPGPGGPETGTLYGAPTPRRPKPPAEVLREEGTSVLIAPGPQPAALTAVLAGLLAVTAALDVRPGLAVAVALLQGVTAAGWFRLNGMWPAREGIALAAAAGLTATGTVLAVDEEDAVIAAVGSLGGWFLLIALVQLRSTQAPKERLTALNVALAAAALAVLAAGYLAAERHAVVVGAVAVAAGTLGRAVPLPPNVSPVAAVAAAGAGGLAAGLGTDMGAAGGLLGLAAGVCVLVAVRVASYDYPSRFVHMTAGVSLPLTLSVPAVHLLGLALL
ncbi:hypothetical protein O7599_22625 [Streptomyces sp. WMMC500]|uniref:hypothetical protein n=1 Tax=Streptomyces sp. WMMC500 TaxID=3015154 RepID=UPI00248CAE0A|nr:hypothetical protein [Streptomyces sp. WMMC500]WBB58423.1 hypothetical protein O7599_22625 [Streptomyces sp. WMMC500]